jgi:membrane protease YdiL (CAAX protease family)
MATENTAFSNQQTFYEQNIEPWVERNGFAHWAMALMWVFLSALFFYAFGLISQFLVILSNIDVGNSKEFTTSNLLELTKDKVLLFMLINTIAQIITIGGMGFLGVKLHQRIKDKKSFLRLKKGESLLPQIGLTVILFIVAFPIVIFLGWINSFLPIPDFMKDLAEQNAEIFRALLEVKGGLFFALLFVGITPAICEELLFRGYMYRALEKSTRVVVVIIVSSLIFSLFHIDLTGLLPRFFLGALLAYVTWTSDSLYPAMVGHLVNNGGLMIAASFNPEMLTETPTPDSELPWLLIGLSFIVTPGVLYLMKKYRSETNPKAEHV